MAHGPLGLQISASSGCGLGLRHWHRHRHLAICYLHVCLVGRRQARPGPATRFSHWHFVSFRGLLPPWNRWMLMHYLARRSKAAQIAASILEELCRCWHPIWRNQNSRMWATQKNVLGHWFLSLSVDLNGFPPLFRNGPRSMYQSGYRCWGCAVERPLEWLRLPFYVESTQLSPHWLNNHGPNNENTKVTRGSFMGYLYFEEGILYCVWEIIQKPFIYWKGLVKHI